MTSSRAAPALGACIALALALTAAPAARAQSTHEPTAQELETARTLFKEGKELRARGDLAGALEKLQAAHALGNTPVTGLELARTYVMLGKIAEAREVALYAARIAVAPDETEKSAAARVEAQKLADDLAPRIPTIAVKIDGLAANEGAHLVIDGVAVPDAAMGEPQKVDPGHHEITVRAGEGPAARDAHAQADLKESETRELTITVPPPAPPPSSPSPSPSEAPEPEPVGESPTHHGGSMPLLAKVGFATGIAGGAVGLIAGLTALNKKGQLDDECGPDKQCTAGVGAPDLHTARTWATVSTVSFVVGGAGALVGLVSLLSGGGDHSAAPAPPGAAAGGLHVAPWIGAGTAGVHGRF